MPGDTVNTQQNQQQVGTQNGAQQVAGSTNVTADKLPPQK